MKIQYNVTDRDGNNVEVGDTVISFRGEPFTFQGVTRGPEYNGTAKVLANGFEYYAQVFDLTVTPMNLNA